MSHYESFTKMLREAEVSFCVIKRDGGLIVHITDDTPDPDDAVESFQGRTGANEGYYGFFTLFHFDTQTLQLTKVGIWE